MMMRLLPRVLVLCSSIALFPLGTGCLDWSFGEGEGEGEAGEGEGEAGEGEGDAGEGEGDTGEGEGEGDVVPVDVWTPLTEDSATRAALAEDDGFFSGPETLKVSSSDDRVFVVSGDRVFVVVGTALDRIATTQVPCGSSTLTGPVSARGDDIYVGAAGAVVVFHGDGSCDPPIVHGTNGTTNTPYALAAGGALILDQQHLYLVDDAGALVDQHDFAGSMGAVAGLFADPAAPGTAALVAPRNFQSGSLPRLTLGADGVRASVEANAIVVTPLGHPALAFIGDQPMSAAVANRNGAAFVDVIDTTDLATPLASMRALFEDAMYAVAADPSGKLAALGSGALVAEYAGGATLSSKTGPRIGSLDRIVVAGTGEVWVSGVDTLLYWTPAAAEAAAAPSAVNVNVDIQTSFDNGASAAAPGALYYFDASSELQRAEIDGAQIVVTPIVDALSFDPIASFVSGRDLEYLPADVANGVPARLVELGSGVAVFELSGDELSVTSVHTASLFLGQTHNGFELFDGARRFATVDSSGFVHACQLELPVGQDPVPTCSNARSANNPTSITVVDPSPGVDDETFIVTESGAVSIVPPTGQSTRIPLDNLDASSRALQIDEGCVLAFAGSTRGWFAVDPDLPAAPKTRRGFAVRDVAELPSGQILAVGTSIVGVVSNAQGQLAFLDRPTATCGHSGGADVLTTTALPSGDVRTQLNLQSGAYLDGALYVLDVDGQVWQVPNE